MIFSKKTRRPKYPALFWGNVEIKEVSKHKQLGIVFNDSMTFKAMKRVTALKCIQKHLTKESRLLVCKLFLQPVLEYGWQLYDNSGKVYISKLEKVQREELCVVYGAYTHTSHGRF